MARICMTSYYGLREALDNAAKSLRDLGNYVIDYPLYKKMYDINDKIPNYIEDFIKYIKDNNIEYVLWWFINIDTNDMAFIKNNTNVKFIFFNWDEPFNWELCDLQNKAKYFDSVFVTCESTLSKWMKYGSKNAYYLLPGFSEYVHYPPYDITEDEYNKYKCDISFCCTNLYDDDNIYSDQIVNRKYLVDKLYQAHIDGKFIFYLYGPEKFNELYPKSYRGFMNYDQSNLVFYCSKINLCTHVIGNANQYLNERVILIGGSGGLLLVDKVAGIENIFDNDNEIIVYDKNDDIVDKIIDILNNYKSYAMRRDTMLSKCFDKYSYSSWAKFINDRL